MALAPPHGCVSSPHRVGAFPPATMGCGGKRAPRWFTDAAPGTRRHLVLSGLLCCKNKGLSTIYCPFTLRGANLRASGLSLSGEAACLTAWGGGNTASSPRKTLGGQSSVLLREL